MRKEDTEENYWALLIILLAVLLFWLMLLGCSPIKRFTNLTSKHPELIKTNIITKDSLVKGKDSLIYLKDTTINGIPTKLSKSSRVDTIFKTVRKDNYIPDKSCGNYVNQLKLMLKDRQRDRDLLRDTIRLMSKERLKDKKLDKQIIRVQNRKIGIMDYIWYLLILALGIFIGRISKTII